MKLLNKVMRQKEINLFLFIGFLAVAGKSTAQLNPMGAAYFQNQYLFNPAMSGLEKELTLNLGYRREWNSVPDGPVNQYFTGDYGFSNKTGLGLLVYNDKAGVLSATRAMATYSYHVPLANDQKLHFGLSAGVLNRRIDKTELNGEPDDPALAEGGSTRFDADFGAAYTDNKFTVQAAFPNMVTFFGKDESDAVDKASFFASAGYKLFLNKGEKLILEPRVAFRGVKGYDNIIDVGANLVFSNHLNLFGIYHSSKSATIGAGLTIKKRLTVSVIYATSTSVLKTYTGGALEAGVKFSLFEADK